MTGDQIGAYFGYAVASGDLNGDGLDDVIVGAPFDDNNGLNSSGSALFSLEVLQVLSVPIPMPMSF